MDHETQKSFGERRRRAQVTHDDRRYGDSENPRRQGGRRDKGRNPEGGRSASDRLENNYTKKSSKAELKAFQQQHKKQIDNLVDDEDKH